METRLALPDDAPVLAGLHSECFGSSRWTEKQFKDSLELDTTSCFLSFDKETPIGFVLYQSSFDEAEILTFCVTASRRRCGVGRRLVEDMRHDLRKRHVGRIFLEVAIDNGAAIALYERFGFHSIGIRKNYYERDGASVDAILFECLLDDLS